jgi:hypothetical protein
MDKLIFDATAFTPVLLDPSNFKITVGDPTVGSYSPWIFNLDVTTPLNKICYIRVYLPQDIAYDFQSVRVTKIFKSERNSGVLLNSEVNRYPATGSDPRNYVVLNGCNDENSLGEAPSGRLIYENFAMPRAKKDSDPFDIEIYKDEDLTQLICKMSAGVRILETNITPGKLTGVSLVPGSAQVQKTTEYTISFTTSHQLEKNSMVEIRMPAGVTLPPVGQTIDLFEITPTGKKPL